MFLRSQLSSEVLRGISTPGHRGLLPDKRKCPQAGVHSRMVGYTEVIPKPRSRK